METSNTKVRRDLFACDDGALYDTSAPGWHKREPLRPVYKRHFSDIGNTAEFKATLRAGPYTFPGGYGLALITNDGGALCFTCARANVRLIFDSIKTRCNDGWQVVGLLNADACEGITRCDNCNVVIGGIEDDEEGFK